MSIEKLKTFIESTFVVIDENDERCIKELTANQLMEMFNYTYIVDNGTMSLQDVDTFKRNGSIIDGFTDCYKNVKSFYYAMNKLGYVREYNDRKRQHFYYFRYKDQNDLAPSHYNLTEKEQFYNFFINDDSPLPPSWCNTHYLDLTTNEYKEYTDIHDGLIGNNVDKPIINKIKYVDDIDEQNYLLSQKRSFYVSDEFMKQKYRQIDEEDEKTIFG